jgi:hypothetical protein
MLSEKKFRDWLDMIVDGLLLHRYYEIKNLEYNIEQKVLEGCKLPTYFVQFTAELDEPVGLEMIVYPNTCFDFNNAVYSERGLARLTAPNIPDIIRATGALIWANRFKALLPNNVMDITHYLVYEQHRKRDSDSWVELYLLPRREYIGWIEIRPPKVNFSLRFRGTIDDLEIIGFQDALQVIKGLSLALLL